MAMLSQIVRPMVRTQIRLLANSQATHQTLIQTIAQWLGFLGVQAHVTQLAAHSSQIHLSLTVGKPEACDTSDWSQIVESLQQSSAKADNSTTVPMTTLTDVQNRQLQRLMAHVIRSGQSDADVAWESMEPALQQLGFDAAAIAGIRAAARVPQPLPVIMEHLDPDVAAIALPKAVSIALLDRRVNPDEDQALTALLQAMKQPA